MPLEYEIRDGALVWIKNPVTGVISYVVDVRGKSFAFTLGGRSELDPAAPTLSAEEIAHAQAACPFCPGNEAMAPVEILRVTPAGFPQWKGDGTASGAGAAAQAIQSGCTPVPGAATTLTFSASARVLYSEVEDARGLF